MLVGTGSRDTYVTEPEVRAIVEEGLAHIDLGGRRVLAIIPDSTRTAPLPMLFRILHDIVGTRAEQLDFLIALGTQPRMTDDQINALLGITADERAGTYGATGIFNHQWDQPETLRSVGTIGADEIEDISGGLMREDVPVTLNQRIFDYDLLLIVGPTFPHEVVGFSGGNKYLFPGIAGPEIINMFHWLGALITNMVIIGTKDTPVRRVVDRAASMVDIDKMCLSMVVTHDGLNGIYMGTPEEAWNAAADLSAEIHVLYKDRLFDRVLSVAPEMYDDLWTGGKCMYKLEPIVADGGEIVIYAPHITEVSYSHGHIIDRIGYHVRDYFLAQMDRFPDIPRGVMAHSTHVKGIGTFENGIESPRISVTLATGIPPERCEQINLGYADYHDIDPKQWAEREDEGVLYVPRAGEMVYRLKD